MVVGPKFRRAESHLKETSSSSLVLWTPSDCMACEDENTFKLPLCQANSTLKHATHGTEDGW